MIGIDCTVLVGARYVQDRCHNGCSLSDRAGNGVVGAAHGYGLRLFPVLLILKCDADNVGSMDVDQVVSDDVNLFEEEPEVSYSF